MAVDAQPNLGRPDPVQSLDGRCHARDYRIGFLAVDGQGPVVDQVEERHAKVPRAVADDVERDKGGGDCISPPIAEADAENADDRGRLSQPVGLIHGGIGVDHLVVETLGNRQLQPRQDDRRNHAVEKGQDHQPAEPDLVPQQFDGADGRVLGVNQLHDGLDEEVKAGRGQRDGCGEVRRRSHAVVAVGEPLVRLPLADPAPNKKDRNRDQAQEIIHPGGLHGLRLPEHEGDDHSRRDDVAERDPLKPPRSRHQALLVGWKLEAAVEPHGFAPLRRAARASAGTGRPPSSRTRSAIGSPRRTATSWPESDRGAGVPGGAPTKDVVRTYGFVKPTRPVHGLSSSRPATTRSSSNRHSAAMSCVSEPGTHSMLALRSLASSSTSCASIPAGRPLIRDVQGGFSLTPTLRTPPRTLFSVPSGSFGNSAQLASRLRRTVRRTAKQDFTGEGGICWTSSPAGIRGKRRLEGRLSTRSNGPSYVLIPPQNDDPAARKLRENQNSPPSTQ